MNQNRLFVGNLSYQTMENDLQDYFSQAGVVTSVNLMLDKMTGKSRGFAFVEFSSSENLSPRLKDAHDLTRRRRLAIDDAHASLFQHLLRTRQQGFNLA